MSKNNRGRTIGLVLLGSTLAVAATAAYLYYNDETRKHLEGMYNREKAKMYVRHRLNGSDALVKAVDSLSDTEINTLVKLADAADDTKDRATDAFDQMIDRAREVGHKVSDYFE